jgi:phage gp45-like
MWISQQMIAAQREHASADAARITGADSAQGVNRYRGLPFTGPWGIAYQPPNAAQAVVVSTSAGDTCIGTLAQDRGISPGELLLFSAGGAEIYLKNTGEIEINGQVFKPKGAA